MTFSPLSDVRLHDGVHSRAQEQMLHLAREYPVDRLLAVFRANAGLDTRGALPPGNWEDFGHGEEEPWSGSDYPGAGVAQTASLLRGHYAGHFLSMLAIAYGSTDELIFKDKSDEMVAGLAEVQQALAATGRFSHPGFLAAYGEWQFTRLEDLAPYGEIWAPWYTCHKIMAGLLDAYQHTGNKQALDVVTRMGHWAARSILAVDPVQRQRMWSLYIAGEYGGMNESLTVLHRITGEQIFLDAAAAFEMDAWLAGAAAGHDVLDGMHANQHLPMLVGHLTQYEVTGERRYLDAVLNLWDQIVPGRTFAHGGTGEGELWGPAGAVARFIGRRNAESCATYNLLKIARGLFTHTRDVKYPDYIERASLNHMVGSRADVVSDHSPEVVYMYPVDPGAVREYDNVGTCCGGTGLESHVKHQESIWYAEPGELYVLQYVPSRLTWADGDVVLQTRYPRDGEITLTIGFTATVTLHLRIPPWARGRAGARVGEESQPAGDGEFVTIRRDWRAGDVVTLTLPMPLRLVPTPDDPALVSLELGPTVLLARDDATTTLSVAPAGARLLDGSITGFTVDDDLVTVLGHTFEPAWSGGDHRYHVYLRLDDADILFHGSDPGVPNRRDQDGWSFLGALWAGGGYATVGEFFGAVHQYVVQAAGKGLLSRAEAEAVLVAASASTLADGVHVIAELPPDVGAESAAPVIRIDVTGERASSGWYTSLPSCSVTVVSPGPGIGSVEITLDGAEWTPVEGPVALPADGRHLVRARATDVSGRIVHVSREIDVDTAPPGASARVRSLGRSVEVTLDAVDDVSGVDRIQWRTAETFWGVFQEPFTRALHDDPQTLEFTATDRAGNTTPVQTVTLPAL
ncbi:glycoside hydrolase family 127 protein [Actinoplanes couchii]|uniref:Glycosyl hydrolase n=1 Tax=Actinoplanes couchii TaxID=403638 RepID=A0ABQ3XL58_9ACTN|nr:hypothetical protein Aco03nite_075490 [Actinoplanes couchii]